MRYGYFDGTEYVIDKPDVPFSMTNYIGVNELCAVLNHTAGGYAFYKTPQFHRITRFRPNGVPMDRPGHYVYLRDDDTGEYFSISWQPVGLSLDKAKYTCRHGLSYSKYAVEYDGINAEQTIFIPVGDPTLLWDVKIKNTGKKRNLSVYSYIEFSYHHIDMDNQNFQMSLYAAGSSYDKGVIEHDLYYEEFGYQFLTSNFEPDGFDCLRDSFIGPYRTETNPLVVETGKCTSSFAKTSNHCGVLQKKLTLAEGEETRLVFMLGQGKIADGLAAKAKYSDLAYVDKCFDGLKQYWDAKRANLQVKTPDDGMNYSLNVWNLYQAEVNVLFSRFASFIEVGGRTGLGYRDTAQDAMTIPHAEPVKCRSRIIELLRGLTTEGYGLHLFDPAWFAPDSDYKPFKSPTVVPEAKVESIIGNLDNVCSDDALWLVVAIAEFIRETGEFSLLDEEVTYADGGKGTVWEHMTKILEFSYTQRGETGICKGLKADWNDCLNLGGGESAMVSFLHFWALEHFAELGNFCGRDVERYVKMAEETREICERELFDGEWYIRGITRNGKKIGVKEDAEGKVHLESNSWAVASGVASGERALAALDSMEKYLSTKYGLMLNAPAYTVPDEDIGFVTRVYPGIKENGAVFSHSNPWVWMAECKIGRGNQAKKYYDSLLGYNQNDIMEIRQAEPYSYCQFVVGTSHDWHGQARHPFMTGTAGWAYYSATKYMLGIRPGFDSLTIDPCIPSEWPGFTAERIWRGAVYNITVENPLHIEKGVKELYVDGQKAESIPVFEPGSRHDIKVIMG